MRVGIVSLLQESNTFSPVKTTLSDFADDVLLTGERIRDVFAAAPHEIGGFFTGIESENMEAVPLFAARAVPWGTIEGGAYAELIQRMCCELQCAGKLDGILFAAHGATVSENIPDVDGYWLSVIRGAIGPTVPLIGTLGLHANLSPLMVESTDALIAYRTNPHLDQFQRGMDAAILLSRTLRGEVRPCQAAAFPPMSIFIECQNSAESPCVELYALTDNIARSPGILSASILMGFPYADVQEMGGATVVVADGSQAIAQQEANRIGRWMWEHREQFVRPSTTVAEALASVTRHNDRVCLLDIGDNIGGGGPGDSTHLAHAVCTNGIGPAVVCISDPAVVRQAIDIGVGESITAAVGGKCSELSGPPLRDTYRVMGLFDGHFSEIAPRHGGFTTFDQGPTAVLKGTGPLTIIATTKRMPPYSIRQITSCDLDPCEFRVLIAKGVHAPLAAYREICDRLIRVDTPGVTAADVRSLKYSRRRASLYPFETNTTWPGLAARCGASTHGALIE